MKHRAAQRVLLAAFLAGVAHFPAHAADAVKAGKWEFTTQLQLPAAQSPAGGQSGPGSGQPMTRTACIDPAHPIPMEGQCKLDDMRSSGSTITWAMTCNLPQGPVQSTGSAHYGGETMQSTLTAHIPGPNGQPVAAPGQITGRYLGPCDAR
jgi:hypothetical protein